MALVLDRVHSQGGHPVFGTGSGFDVGVEIGIAVVVDVGLNVFILVGIDGSQDGLC